MQTHLHIDHLLLQRHHRKPVEAQESFATKLVLRISLCTQGPKLTFCKVANKCAILSHANTPYSEELMLADWHGKKGVSL
jgi:hypothetical protein